MSPKLRETLYYLGTIVPAIVGIALVWGSIDQGVADSVDQLVVGLLNLLGASAPAVAAKNVREQRKDGTLSTDPVEQVIKNLPVVVQNAAAANDALDKVRQAVNEGLQATPVLGSLVQQILHPRQTLNATPFTPQHFYGADTSPDIWRR